MENITADLNTAEVLGNGVATDSQSDSGALTDNPSALPSKDLGKQGGASGDESGDDSAVMVRPRESPYPWEATARLARRYRHLRTQLVRFHRELAQAVEAKHGAPLTVLQRKLIVDAVRHEAICRLAEARLAKQPDCSIPDFNSLLTRIAAATDASTRAIAKLDLDIDATKALVSRLYGKRKR